jgi:hypothetical protein
VSLWTAASNPPPPVSPCTSHLSGEDVRPLWSPAPRANGDASSNLCQCPVSRRRGMRPHDRRDSPLMGSSRTSSSTTQVFLHRARCRCLNHSTSLGGTRSKVEVGIAMIWNPKVRARTQDTRFIQVRVAGVATLRPVWSSIVPCAWCCSPEGLRMSS